MLIPSPAGTGTGRPFTNTSRCACTWYWSCSRRSGTRPAARVLTSGSGGAGHGAASLAGVGAAGAVYACSVEEDDFFELPQPRKHSARTRTAATPPKRMVRRPYPASADRREAGVEKQLGHQLLPAGARIAAVLVIEQARLVGVRGAIGAVECVEDVDATAVVLGHRLA